MRHALIRRAALCAVFALVVASCGGVATEPSSPESGTIPVVVDGDLGPDDLMALLFLLQRPDVDLLAITVSGTGLAHCPEGADNAAALLEHVGRAEIPVGCGTDTPLQGGNSFPEEWRLGADGLGAQLGLPIHEARTHEEATQLLVDTIRSSTEPARLLSLGPLTNIAGALIAEPDLAESIGEVVIMGGAVDVSGTVAPAYEAEWNFWVDPHAANVVLESGIPIRLVPLDATNDVPATRFFFEMLEAEHATPEADLVYRYFSLNPSTLDGGAYFLWDPLAAVTLVDPGVVTIESRNLTVVEEAGGEQGKVETLASAPSIEVAIAADTARFESEFLTALNDGKEISVQVPEPDLTVHFDGEACAFDGPTAYRADGATTRIVVELINDTEGVISLATGLHEGATWEQLSEDAAAVQAGRAQPPAYWELTGSITMQGQAMTGGRSLAPLDLPVGTHALVCGTEDGRLFLLTDLEVGSEG